MAASTASKSIYRLFIGNVPWTVSGLELKQYFSQFGHVASAKVIFDRETGMSKHYGFVEIADKNTYDDILSKRNFRLDGRTMHVSEAAD